jgi:HAD superfamily hydrolase (TIGR01509 family)
VLVILDSDGVLVDSEPLSNRELAAMLTELGLPTSAEESMATFMGRSWPACAELIEERLGRALPEDFADTYHERLYAAIEKELRPVAGVVDVLDSLEHRTCVASSGSHEKLRRTLGRTGLLGRFEGRIFSANEVANGKPAPDLFLHAAAAMGFAPRDCVVVEDSPLGIEAAHAAGMKALGFAARTPPERLAGADAVFADMGELPRLLATLRRS